MIILITYLFANIVRFVGLQIQVFVLEIVNNVAL